MRSYFIETSYFYWRVVRDAVRGLIPRPAPVPMPDPPDRAELFAQLHALRAQRAAEADQHRQAVDALTDQWHTLQGQAEAVRQQIQALQWADFGANLTFSAEEDVLRRQIVAKSSMSVQLFIEELDAELDRVHRAEALVLPSAHRNYVLGKKTMGISTDAPSRKRRATALHAARARAVAMRDEPMTIERMNTELMRLRRTIPAIEHEVIHGERASIVAYN